MANWQTTQSLSEYANTGYNDWKKHQSNKQIGKIESTDLNNLNNFNKVVNSNEPGLVNTSKTEESNGKKGKGVGDFIGSIGNFGIGAKSGDIIAGIPEMFGAGEKYGSFSKDEKAAQSAIRSGLEMIPIYGPAIAAATGIVDSIGSATGLNLNSVNSDDASRAGITGMAFNKIMNVFPGNSMIWGGISALFGNKRTDSLFVSDDAKSMANGYNATLEDLNIAENVSNKRLFFGQTDQANNFINSQKENARIMTEIGRVNTQRKQSDYYQDLQHQNINLYAGQNYLGMTVGKKGMKLMSVEEARKIIALKKAEETPEKLQNGGNIPGIDSSILPEGALHARKNNLSEINPELEDVTKKGIPVVAENGGEIQEQVAEIEENEIIFRLEVTKRIEELMKDGSDEAMIECGKIITCEVIDNTEDNTGQITEEVQNGE